ncbi:MAG: polymer-forming cytoskeletal protein [Kiloniellales bacterium]
MPPDDISPSRAPSPSPGVPSIISADLKIVGDLHSNGDLQIDGAVEGDITSRSVTVGESAVVRGSLVAENVRVYGAVFGQIKANSVTLAKTAKVEGNVVHQALSMEAGAVLSGNLSRLDKAVGGGARAGTAERGTAARGTAAMGTAAMGTAAGPTPDEKTDRKSNGSGAASAVGGSTSSSS